MNKLSISKQTLKLVIVTFTLLGGIYASYTYIIIPLLLKKTHLESSEQSLDIQLRDTKTLEVRLSELKKEVSEKEVIEQNKPQAPQYTALSYLDFVDYIGALEKNSGVDVLSLQKDDYLMSGQYYEIPYTIEIAGDYIKLLKFTNGLSEIEGFLVWTSANLGWGSSILTSDKNLLLSTDWATQIKSILGRQYPKETDFSEPNTETTEDSSSFNVLTKVPTETPESKVSAHDISQDRGTLHLELSFKFITVEDPLRVGVR